MSLQDYLNHTMADEMALKGRVRQLYEQKDALRGFGEIDGGAANSWTRFIHRFTKDKKKSHTMAELKKEYQKYKANLAKRRVAAKKKPVKKVVAIKKPVKKTKSTNPWFQFLAEYRASHPGFSDQAALMREASIKYKKLTGRGFDGDINPQNLTGDDLDNYIDNYKGYDEDEDDPRYNDAYLSDLCSDFYGEDQEGGFGTKAGAKKNKWIAFLKKKSNKGKTRAQILKLYKQQNSKKKAPAKKKVAAKRKPVKKSGLSKIKSEAFKDIDKYIRDEVKKATAKKKVGKRKTIGGVLLDY